MAFAPAYLIERFFYRLADFFHHWYVDGSRAIGRHFMEAITAADRSLALRVTARYFFQPLYRDYSFIGRILGIAFRSVRIAIGLAVYAAVAVLFLAFYLAWVAAPAALLFYALRGLR